MKHRLLTSQEDILARLVHNINYGDGLVVLSGEKGSGRTTIAISLLEELDVYNQALITCPEHMKLTEVRQKIVEQLFVNPLFNEDDPLPDTLLRLANGRSQSMLIIFDDASSLSSDIVEEVLLLSHLQSQGIRLRVMFVTHTERALELKQKLPKKYGCQVLIFDVPLLSDKESADLYQRLIARTTVQPPVSLGAVHRYLNKTEQTPAQVIEVVQFALHTPEILTQNKGLLFYFLSGSLIFILLAFFGAWIWLMDLRDDVQQDIKKIEVLTSDEQPIEKFKPEPLEHTEEETNLPADPVINNPVDDEQTETLGYLEPPQLLEDHFKRENYKATWPSLGYTVQIASVKNLDSLSSTWFELNERSDLFLFKRSNRFILMMGRYQNMEEAQKAVMELGLDDTTWIRRWSSIDLHRMERMLLIDAI